MTTLGIYGDSFAAVFPKKGLKEWSVHLQKDYEVTNYAVGGSDIYFSYKNFINTQTKHEKIVFVAAHPCRFYNFILQNERGIKTGISSPAAIINYRNLNSNIPNDIKYKLAALEQYYLYLQDESVCEDLFHLMLKEVRNIRPDAIIIHTQQKYSKGEVNFWDYRKLFIRSIDPSKLVEFQENSPWWEKYKENKTWCHLSEEINVLVAEHIKQAIENKVWAPTLPYTLPHNNSFDYYYTTI